MCDQGAAVSSPPQAQRSRAIQRAKSAIPCSGVRRGERLFRIGAWHKHRYNETTSYGSLAATRNIGLFATLPRMCGHIAGNDMSGARSVEVVEFLGQTFLGATP